MRVRTLVAATVLALVAVLPSTSSTSSANPQPPSYLGAETVPDGSFALRGPAARKFTVPDDMVAIHTSTRRAGGTTTRYQQVVDDASVLGGQVTIVRSLSGRTRVVVGSHFRDLRSANEVDLSRTEARRAVQRRIGDRGEWTATLRIDPASRLSFYEVGNIRDTGSPVRWVDAESGEILRSFDAVRHGDGTGVKNDRKRLSTSRVGNVYALLTPDGRQRTLDAQNDLPGLPTILMTDDNDHWNRSSIWTSPDQRAGVDAHYYAGVVDRFYRDVFNRNSLDDAGMPLVSVVHMGQGECNAFWDGESAYFGDGDATGPPSPHRPSCLPTAGALDVVAHEFTHGITQYTSRLYAGPESIPLNEGFSDIMGTAIEFFAAARGLDPAARPDWRFGEDVVSPRSSSPGFRSLADPGEDGSLDHYSELTDAAGAHEAGMIAAHSFYLASQGGGNAGCVATGTRPATHTADCGVVVPALGIARTQRIYYDGITSLTETDGFCEARNATVAFAGPDAAAVSSAWQAVGVAPDCTPYVPPPPPPPPEPGCEDQPEAQLPFESTHPYANFSDCVWIFDNGTPGFAFHFSDLAVESDYDFVVVRDGDGNVLGVYSGDWGADAPPTCIPTSVGMVQLYSDEYVVDRGFVVDAVVSC